ncbi:hypothetical protein HS99_0009855 [Kitasatospora aureofaciens]|uniref:Uncharacterized protein n=1 Tax=Kitasatospora aureofaciens TaxID=1894 RepID=A0A1E7N260_KITAU|nr:hypothetical protein HS99_0009855 [Kitasatospora aureofaciens]
MRHGREHLLDVGRFHAAFVADARARGEACGPLDLLPGPELPAGGVVYRPAAELAYTAGTGDERQRQRAFVERHLPGVGPEETAAQLSACAALWEQPGPEGRGRAWERRRRSFPRLLIVLVGTAASGVRSAMADLHLADEENPTVAEALNQVLDQARSERMSVTAALERLLEIEVEATGARRMAAESGSPACRGPGPTGLGRARPRSRRSSSGKGTRGCRARAGRTGRRWAPG